MAGVGGCGRRRRLGAGRLGTGVRGRIHRVYQDRHDHFSHDNTAVGGRDVRASVAEGEVSITPSGSRSQPGTLIGVGPGLWMRWSLRISWKMMNDWGVPDRLGALLQLGLFPPAGGDTP